ncbi:MAG TPA: hypothetical protein VFV23_07235 [Verrucomicrobiae bacterium]|nr:hypothetical protein [Verrucomicrobiae bacterium]
MKRMLFLSTVVSTAVLFTSAPDSLAQIKTAPTNPPAASSGSWQNVKTNATQSWHDIKETLGASADYTFQKKDEFVAKAKTDLKALDAKIKELSKKTSSSTGDTKAAAQDKMKKLKVERAELAKKLKEAKAATADDWDKAKAGFTNGYAQVKQSVKDAWDWASDKMKN